MGDPVALLTVADPEVGLGHLYRIDALAQSLMRFGDATVELLVSCTAGEGWLRERKPLSKYHLESWNTTPLVAEELAGSRSIIVVDAYQIDRSVWAALTSGLAQLAVFDDYGEKPPFRGLLINGSPGGNLLHYIEREGQRLLIGPRYQVLRPAFWQRSNKRVAQELSRILVMAGGTDAAKLGRELATTVLEATPPRSETLFVGGGDWNAPGVRHTGFLSAERLRELMMSADLLVTPAGQSVAEAVSCALPTVTVQSAENQRLNALGWAEVGAAQFASVVGAPDWRATLGETVRRLIGFEERQSLASSAEALDLANSTERVASRILGLPEPLRLVRFQDLSREQLDLVLRWRNDARVRKWMDHPEPIAQEDHYRFVQGLASRDDAVYYLAYQYDEPVGVINLTGIESGEAELGVYRRPDRSGRGYGELLMRDLEREASFLSVSTLKLKVARGNSPAKSLYQRWGYEVYRQDGRYLYMKKELN